MEQPTFRVETGQLRPGVPLVRVWGWLDGPAGVGLRLILDRCLDGSPWAVVVELSALSGSRAAAASPLVEIASRAATTDIGLYLVTTGGAVDRVLGDRETGELFDIHHSVESVERTLGGRG